MNKPAQFTPGPWSLCNWMVGNNTPTGEVTICGPEGDEHICTMDGNENNQANAHLIAAAPVMYKALRLAEHNLTEIENYIGGDAVPAGLLDTVRAAIAQAEGGTL